MTRTKFLLVDLSVGRYVWLSDFRSTPLLFNKHCVMWSSAFIFIYDKKLLLFLYNMIQRLLLFVTWFHIVGNIIFGF